MQEQREPIEQLDPFSDYLNRRLKEHRMPEAADGWEAIDASMRRRNLRKRLWMTGLLAAVAIFLGVVWFIPTFVIHPLPIEMADQPAATPPASEPLKPSVAEIIPAPPTPSLAQPQLSISQPTSQPLIAADSARFDTDEEKIPIDTKEKKETPQTKQKENKREATVPADNKGYKRPAGKTNIQPSKGKRSSSWLLAAGFGSTSSISTNWGETEDFKSLPSNNFDSEGNYLGIGEQFNNLDLPPQFNDYGHASYLPPLSFGLTARKVFASGIALESGLVYTYLRNNYDHSIPRHASEYFHYLGIPVNVSTYLINKPKWNIYLSGGVMAEKCISYSYNTTHFILGNEVNYSGHAGIDGIQWSLNGAIGIAYRIQRHWSLYAEPRVSYFFDSNQPQTSRTEHPLNLGIGGGIRFEF